MEISQQVQPDSLAVVTICGRVTIQSEPKRIEQMARDLIAQGCRAIVFDLNGVTHLDSTGIGQFILALNMALKANSKLAIVGATTVVRESFHVTRLDTIFKFYETLEAARAALG
jgi:anti-anti-sigma factor